MAEPSLTNPTAAARAPYNEYQVLKPLPAMSGPAAPWFGQPGLGTQHELFWSVENLVHNGYLGPVSP